MSGAQPVGRLKQVGVDLIVTGLNIDGNDLADVLFRLDLGSKRLLVQFLAAPRNFRTTEPGMSHASRLLIAHVYLHYSTRRERRYFAPGAQRRGEQEDIVGSSCRTSAEVGPGEQGDRQAILAS